MKFNYLGTNVNYEVIGNGEPIVFLHGWQSSMGSFSILIEQLRHNYKLVLIDFPPFGKSGKLNSSWDVNTYSDMIFELLKLLNLQNFYILAHSFGGRVAINLCTCYNCNVKKLILTGSAGLKPRRSVFHYFKVKKYKRLKKQIEKNKEKSYLLESFGSNDYKMLDDLMKKTFVKIVNFNQEKIVKQIKIPTLIIYGQNDKETPIYMAKKFNKLIKNSELEIVKNTGHFCFLEQPEIFYDILIHFIKKD